MKKGDVDTKFFHLGRGITIAWKVVVTVRTVLARVTLPTLMIYFPFQPSRCGPILSMRGCRWTF